MIDDATLHDMIQEEREHFKGLERRRVKAVKLNESRDIIAHYDDMQNRSLRAYNALLDEKYRREYEHKK